MKNSKEKGFIITAIGVLVGAVVGYLYYHYVGCLSGTCSITSKPLNSILYGSLFFGVLFNLILREKKFK